MTAFPIAAFTLLLGVLNAIPTNQTKTVTRIVYDKTSPAGWMIVADGPSGTRIVCPKPCESVKLPPPR